MFCVKRDLEQKQQHYETKIEQQKQKYEALLEQQREQQQQYYETELEQQKQKYEALLEQQREQLLAQTQKIEKLENQIFEIAKQPKQTNTNINNHTTTTTNQRTVNIMNQLAPYEFDTDEIQRVLREHFTSEVFRGGPDKIAELVAKFLLTDPETQKPRVVCTDASRKMFRYIDPDSKELQTDSGLHNTHKIIKKPLVQANLSVFLETRQRDEPDEGDEHRDTWKRNDDFIEHQNKFPEKVSLYLNK